MADLWQYMNKVNGWDKVDTAVTTNVADLPQFEMDAVRLREKGQLARTLFAQQAALTAARQEVTRELNQVIVDGDALVDFIKTGVRVHYGKDSEKLVEFGIRPFRSRSRSSAPKPPTPETTAPTSPSPDPAK
jgi:hypothetical protein